jgi:16S rRNA (cytidine1402-2'-O)-methyltransferase
MTAAARPVEPGLHFVATPIGTARDITLRALDVLAGAEVLAAEDTRTARKLMDIHGIALGGRPLVAYHDHNGPAVRPRLLAALGEGRSVAYVSEAGTPLVADPGYALARAAIAAGHPVHSVPGPSAVLAALTVSGLPTDRFLFAGFPPPKSGERRRFLADLAGVPATLVIFEAPGRAAETLAACRDAFGADREAALCRELTKRFEEVRRGTLGALAEDAARNAPRGEVVLVVGRAAAAEADPAEVDRRLAAALETMTVRDAAAQVADALSLPRRQVYQAALALARDRRD